MLVEYRITNEYEVLVQAGFVPVESTTILPDGSVEGLDEVLETLSWYVQVEGLADRLDMRVDCRPAPFAPWLPYRQTAMDEPDFGSPGSPGYRRMVERLARLAV